MSMKSRVLEDIVERTLRPYRNRSFPHLPSNYTFESNGEITMGSAVLASGSMMIGNISADTININDVRDNNEIIGVASAASDEDNMVEVEILGSTNTLLKKEDKMANTHTVRFEDGHEFTRANPYDVIKLKSPKPLHDFVSAKLKNGKVEVEYDEYKDGYFVSVIRNRKLHKKYFLPCRDIQKGLAFQKDFLNEDVLIQLERGASYR